MVVSERIKDPPMERVAFGWRMMLALVDPNVVRSPTKRHKSDRKLIGCLSFRNATMVVEWRVNIIDIPCVVTWTLGKRTSPGRVEFERVIDPTIPPSEKVNSSSLETTMESNITDNKA